MSAGAPRSGAHLESKLCDRSGCNLDRLAGARGCRHRADRRVRDRPGHADTHRLHQGRPRDLGGDRWPGGVELRGGEDLRLVRGRPRRRSPRRAPCADVRRAHNRGTGGRRLVCAAAAAVRAALPGRRGRCLVDAGRRPPRAPRVSPHPPRPRARHPADGNPDGRTGRCGDPAVGRPPLELALEPARRVRRSRPPR